MWFDLGLRWLLCTPGTENRSQGKDRNADVRRTEPLVVAAETKKKSRLAEHGLLTSHMIKLLQYGRSTPSPLPPPVQVHSRLVASSRTEQERKDDKAWHGPVGSRRAVALTKSGGVAIASTLQSVMAQRGFSSAGDRSEELPSCRLPYFPFPGCSLGLDDSALADMQDLQRAFG